MKKLRKHFMKNSLKKSSFLLKSLCLPMLMASSSLQAATPSAAQIEMFKSLPQSQQAALMKQYGVSPNSSQVSGVTPVVQDTTAEKVIEARNIEQDIKSSEQVEEARDATDKADLTEKQVTTEVKETIKPFGYDLFAGTPSTFAPLANAPVPADYIVGPGDTLNVQVYGAENRSYQLQLDRQGQVQLPQVGPVQLAGLSFSKASSVLEKEIKRASIGVEVSITAGALRSIRVFVLGDVHQPGAYVVSGLSTMSNALLSSGGVKTIGSLRNIQLKRNGKVISTLDLYDFLLKGDMSADVPLLEGDVLFVPTLENTVAVAGEVRRPAVYELKGEKTVGDILKLAGGFKQSASPADSKLERIREDGYREVKDVNLLAKRSLSQTIQSGDTLRVLKTVDEYKDIVLIKGSLSRPGEYQWQPGLRIADLFKGNAQDVFLPQTDLEHVFIKREVGFERQAEILMVNLKQALYANKSSNNIELEPRDEVLILNFNQNRAAALASWVNIMKRQARRDQLPRIVTISGSVNYPGTYPLPKGLTAESLLSLAGGAAIGTEKMGFLVHDSDVNRDLEVELVSVDDSLGMKKLEPMDELIFLNEEITPINQPAVQPLINRLQAQVKRDALPSVVKISGSVNHPGTYPYAKNMTVGDLLTLAGGTTMTTMPKALLRHESGVDKKVSVDLVDLSGDLMIQTLTSMDELIVFDQFSTDEFKARIQQLNNRLRFQASASEPSQLVSVTGFVRFPGEYPLTQGMTPNDLIALAGGLVESAYEVDGEIVRRSIDPSSRKMSVKDEVLSLDSASMASYDLQTMDTVIVKQKPEWRERQVVTLSGEVKFPGTYALNENETLADLIKRAGGFTKNAFIEGTVLQRAKLVERQAQELEKMRSQLEASLAQNAAGLATVSPDAAAYLNNVLKEANAVKATGRLSLVNRSGDIMSAIEKVKLKDGDTLFIPDAPQTVSVIGEVFATQTFSFDETLSAQDYLQMAGGANSLADVERAYIVKASGQVQPMDESGFFYAMEDQQISQGDVIVVPMDPDQFRDLKEWKEITAIASQIVLAIASIKTIGVF